MVFWCNGMAQDNKLIKEAGLRYRSYLSATYSRMCTAAGACTAKSRQLILRG